jgi:hypothetical protein
MIKRLILLALLAFGLVGPVDAAGLYPLSRMQRADVPVYLWTGERFVRWPTPTRVDSMNA